MDLYVPFIYWVWDFQSQICHNEKHVFLHFSQLSHEPAFLWRKEANWLLNFYGVDSVLCVFFIMLSSKHFPHFIVMKFWNALNGFPLAALDFWLESTCILARVSGLSSSSVFWVFRAVLSCLVFDPSIIVICPTHGILCLFSLCRRYRILLQGLAGLSPYPGFYQRCCFSKTILSSLGASWLSAGMVALSSQLSSICLRDCGKMLRSLPCPSLRAGNSGSFLPMVCLEIILTVLWPSCWDKKQVQGENQKFTL